MTELRIELDRLSFKPGDELTGSVEWRCEKAPQKMELRLFWFTRGKGTEDVGVVETVRFEQPQLNEKRKFRMRLPESPYSFSGRLISLIWALELVAELPRQAKRVEIVVGPQGQEVRLDNLPELPGQDKGRKLFAWNR